MADDLFALYAQKTDGFRPVLICNGSLDPRMVVGEKEFEGKRYIICLADLRMENPPTKHLYRNPIERKEVKQ